LYILRVRTLVVVTIFLLVLSLFSWLFTCHIATLIQQQPLRRSFPQFPPPPLSHTLHLTQPKLELEIPPPPDRPTTNATNRRRRNPWPNGNAFGNQDSKRQAQLQEK